MIEYVVLGKAVAPLAGKAAAIIAQKTVASQKRPWDIAADVADAIEGFPIEKSNLRAALKKPALIEALCDEDPERGARQAVQLFKVELRKQESWRNLDADELERRCGRVVEETAKVLLRNLPVPEAIALVDDRSAARDEAAAARAERIYEEVKVIRDQTAGPSLLDRADLHPAIESDLRELVENYPRAAALVEILTNATDPAEDLASWVEKPPTWLREVPLRIWTIVGISLSVVGRPIEAAAALKHAIVEGISDRRRWAAHAAHYLCQGDAHTAARELIADHTTGHGAALLATLDDNLPQALAALNAWTPDNDFDHDTKVLLTAAVLEAQDDTLQAIRVLRERRPTAQAAAITLKLAKLLLDEAYAGRAASRDDQLREAAELAIEARNLRRRWRGNSVEAVLVAADALGQLHDYPTALKHLRPPPDGDALDHEASHPDIKSRAATAATAMGDLTLAAQLDDVGAFAEAFMAAIRLEQADDGTKASTEAIRASWARVLAESTEDTQRLTAATRLLIYGGHSPVIDELRQQIPSEFAEVDQVVAALSGTDQGVTISRLRGIRRTNRLAVMTLADLYGRQSRPDEAANTLAEAADSFDDQHLRLLAATRWVTAGNMAKAAEEAKRALDKTGRSWPGRQRSQQIVLKHLLSRGELTEFISVARQYLLDYPDPAVRWALAFAHMKERDPRAAWRVINESPTLLHPLQPLDALLYLDLLAQFGSRKQVVTEAVTALKRFGMGDERFAAAVFAATLTARSDDDASQEPAPELAELGGLIDAFATRYPDSQYFRRFVGDPDDPEGSAEQMLEEMLRILRPGHEQRLTLGKEVNRGLHPTGILTSVLGRTYAEGFLLRAGGGLRVRSWIPTQQQADQADADSFLQAVGALSIVDASALHTCSLLPEAVRDIIMAHHTRLQVTADSMADLADARDSVALTDSRFGLDDNGLPRITEQDNIALGRRAQLMIDLASRADRVPSADIPGVDEVREPERFKPWLLLAATAHERQSYLWCDDEVLRRFARAQGVQTFSTLELIEALVEKNAVSETQRNEILQILISQYTFDLPLSIDLLVAQAETDGWAGGAATAALARPATWAIVRNLFGVIDDAIRNNASTPETLDSWSYAATMGSCATQPDPESVSDLAKLLLIRCIIGANLSPSAIPPIVRGVRTATEELSAPDPLPAALKELHEVLLTRIAPADAARLIIQAISGLEVADRHALVQAVLVTRR